MRGPTATSLTGMSPNPPLPAQRATAATWPATIPRGRSPIDEVSSEKSMALRERTCQCPSGRLREPVACRSSVVRCQRPAFSKPSSPKRTAVLLENSGENLHTWQVPWAAFQLPQADRHLIARLSINLFCNDLVVLEAYEFGQLLADVCHLAELFGFRGNSLDRASAKVLKSSFFSGSSTMSSSAVLISSSEEISLELNSGFPPKK